MIPQYSHDVVTSVTMWLDSLLLVEGQAYVNVSGALYLQPVVAGQPYTYTSPYRSWVYDRCATGAVIPSGFNNASGQFLTRESGLVIDFVNGRVLSPNNWGPQLNGSYARKEVNVYYSSDQEVQYVLEQVQNENKNLTYGLTGLVRPGMPQKMLAAPLVMLTNARGKNHPFALGGMDNSKNNVRAFVITDSNYLQEGVNSLIQDQAHTTIPFAPYSAWPLTTSGDLKAVSGWSYCRDIYDAIGCDGGLYMEGIIGYKISEKVNRNTTFFISMCDIQLSKPRFTRV